MWKKIITLCTVYLGLRDLLQRTANCLHYCHVKDATGFSESPSSVNDVLCPCHIGWLWRTRDKHQVNYFTANKVALHWFLWNIKSLHCGWAYTLYTHSMTAWLFWASTYLIWGQVYTQVCHLLSCTHSASFLSCHEILISLWRGVTFVAFIIFNTQPSGFLLFVNQDKMFLLYDSCRHYCQIKNGENDMSTSEPTVPVLGQVGPGSYPSVMEYQQSLRKYKRAALTFFWKPQ